MVIRSDRRSERINFLPVFQITDLNVSSCCNNNKEAQLLLWKMHYSLYSSCCST